MSQDVRIMKLGQAVTDLGDPRLTGRSIAQIINFLLRKIPYAKRPHAIMELRKKIWELSEYDMAAKKSPDTASLGQSITFVKTLLNGKQPYYIRQVLSEIVRNL